MNKHVSPNREVIKKILVSCWLFSGIQMLVPKKIGTGFLKVPVGHHHANWLDDLPYDITGLDGYIDIECDCHPWEEVKRDAILTEIMPMITKKFGFDWQLVDSKEFARQVK